MTAPPGGTREEQYAAALDARSAADPDTYGPFTVHEYADSDWQTLDWCTRWPVGAGDNPAGPPRPPVGPLPARAGAGAQRRAGLDHHRGRGRPDRAAVPGRPARRRAQQLPRDRRRRHRRLRAADRALVRRVARGADPGAAAALRRTGRSRCGRWGRFPASPPWPDASGVAVARRGGAHRGRPAGPLVEQLQRPRRRPARRHLELLRRPRGALPAAPRPARPRGCRSPARPSGTATPRP